MSSAFLYLFVVAVIAFVFYRLGASAAFEREWRERKKRMNQ
jgi:uncharacterized membrane protein YsdA (DUF1294 family)